MSNVIEKAKSALIKTAKNDKENNGEHLADLTYYEPATDIYESEAHITLQMNIPGVSKEGVKIDLEDNKLNIDATLNVSHFEKLNPVYTEYNVGHYSRTFKITDVIDKEKIEAEVKDGVLRLLLPKKQSAQVQRIQIK